MVDVTIEGPGKNALSTAVMEALIADLERAGGEAALITGAGDVFSAGLNLKEVVSLDRAGMARFIDTLERLVETLYLYPGPTLACVNGHAIAGGCVVALCCDHRVAVDAANVRIGLNEVAIGVHYPPRLFAVVRQRLPRDCYDRVVLGAELHDPTAAVSLGLVDEVSTDPRRTATERLEVLARHPSDAYASAKLSQRTPVMALGADEQRRLADVVVPSWASEETKTRLAALLGGRG